MGDFNIWIEITKQGSICDNIILTDFDLIYNNNENEHEGNHIKSNVYNQNLYGKYNAWLIGYFIHTLERSIYYRYKVIRNIIKCSKNPSNSSFHLILKLDWPKKLPLDLNWNDKLHYLAIERRELSHAMAWLSTLGGAFSALGEKFISCAEIAGRISIGQMKLALRIGDPSIIARCKLWFSLSLMQRGYYKESRFLILEQWDLLKKQNQKQPLLVDQQLIKICQGLWSKLQYEKKINKNDKLIKAKTLYTRFRLNKKDS